MTLTNARRGKLNCSENRKSTHIQVQEKTEVSHIGIDGLFNLWFFKKKKTQTTENKIYILRKNVCIFLLIFIRYASILIMHLCNWRRLSARVWWMCLHIIGNMQNNSMNMHYFFLEWCSNRGNSERCLIKSKVYSITQRTNSY